MPSFILEYDIDYDYFTEEDSKTPAAVYSPISRKLTNLGWYRTQYSVWRQDNISFEEADENAQEFQEHIENLYSEDIFQRLHYQRYTRAISLVG